MTDVVGGIYRRHARRSRAGRVIRCNRGRYPSGPILFPTLDAARAAVTELASVGHRHQAVPCLRGRHWHVCQLPPKEDPMPEPVDLSWARGSDGDAVRAAARRRVGGDATPPDTEVADCTAPECAPCRKAARAAVG